VKPLELRDRYNRCCDAKAYAPNKGQLDEWRVQLGHLEPADLDRAIDEWFENNAQFPAPSNLRVLAVKYQRTRQVKAHGPEELSCHECTTCGTRITSFRVGFSPQKCSGYIPRGPDRGNPCMGSKFRLLYREAVDPGRESVRPVRAQVLAEFPAKRMRDKAAAVGDYDDAA